MFILYITVLIDLIGFGLIIPILPFMAPEFGASHLDIAFLITVYSVLAGICAPYWGKLSDRIGRKPVILICLVGASVSYLMLAFATTLWMLYVARAFGGLMAGNFGVASAMVADISKPQDRSKYMGIIGSAFGLGMVIGPFMGGLLSGNDGNFFLPCVVAAGMSMMACLAGSIFLRESLDTEKRDSHAQYRADQGHLSSWAVLKKSGNRLLVSQYFWHSMAITTVSYLFPLWVGSLLGWGPREVGMVFGVQGLAMAALQGFFVGKLAQRFGELPLLLMGSLMMLAGFVVASQAVGMAMMLVAFFLVITGATCCTPILNGLTSKRSSPAVLGQVMGTASAMSAWGRSAGPLIAGLILTQFSFSLAWLVGIIYAGSMLAWIVSERSVNRSNPESAIN